MRYIVVRRSSASIEWQAMQDATFTEGVASSVSFAAQAPPGSSSYIVGTAGQTGVVNSAKVAELAARGITLDSANKRLAYDGVGTAGVVSNVILEDVTTAAADWQARTSAAGVLWAQRFQSVADVSSYTGGVPYQPTYQQFIAGAGVIAGDGALRQFVPANTQAAGRWGRPIQPMPGDINQPGVPTRPNVSTQQSWNEQNGFIMHPTYAAGAHGSPPRTGVSIGSEFYVQFRVKFSVGRFTNAGAVESKMVMIETNYNSPYQELVLRSRSGGSMGRAPQMYTSQGNLFNSALEAPQGSGPGSSSIRQPNSNYVLPSGPYAGQTAGAACSFNNGVAGCWQWPENEWVVVLMHFKPGLHAINTSDPTNAGNAPARNTVVEMKIATEAAVAAGAGYTTIHSKSDYVWYYDDTAQWNAAGGYQAYGVNWFNLNFYTGGPAWVNSTIDWYHQFDQIICSLQPIACPQV